jgi:hypothetical protein
VAHERKGGQFPANREINSEFHGFRASPTLSVGSSAGYLSLFAMKFPTQRNREFPDAYQGINWAKQGISGFCPAARNGSRGISGVAARA